jgi:ABC-type dipeptide/oligopeptide/nickel transport system permease component
MFDILTSAVVLAIVALLLGAAAQWRRGERLRALLMAIAALVIAGNVAIWSVPLGH